MKKKPAKPRYAMLRIAPETRDQLKVSAAQLGISIKALVARLAAQRQ